MEPTPIVLSQPVQPRGPWLVRGARALIRERRLPTRAVESWDRLCRALGFRYKTVSLGGCRVRVRRLTGDIHFAGDALVRREYTPPGFEIRESDTVIDVGGNIGGFALQAARLARRGRVITFEPVRDNFDVLEMNLRANRAGNVVAVRAAILDRRDVVRIYLSEESTGTHTIVESLAEDARRYEEVEAIPLSEVFERHGIERCQFLKMNCEGAEFAILRTLSPEMFRRIDTIVLQYHGRSPETKRSDAGELIAILEGAGYRIGFYTDVVGTERGFIGAQRQASEG